MKLDEALVQIDEIRRQLAKTETTRGFRAVPVAFSGLLAIIAAAVQPTIVPNPLLQVRPYLCLWVGVAAISALAVGSEIIRRWSSKTRMDRQATCLAVEQFLPCLIAGGLLAVQFGLVRPAEAWTLPGLWAILFGLGLFASCRLLPPEVFWVAAFYLMAGLAGLALAGDGHSLSPWAMGLPFGIGQLLFAAVLYVKLERNHGQNRTDR